MREIEFRAIFKKIATGEVIWQKSALARGKIIDPKNELPLGYMQITDWEQYTGLTDKNGKKIFEGDLCYLAGVGTACVQWSEYTLSFVFVTDQNKNEYEYQDIIEDLDSLEIIGNIHE